MQFSSLLSVKMIRKCTSDDRGKKQQKLNDAAMFDEGGLVRVFCVAYSS